MTATTQRCGKCTEQPTAPIADALNGWRQIGHDRTEKLERGGDAAGTMRDTGAVEAHFDAG
jgi:hypothetical protein